MENNVASFIRDIDQLYGFIADSVSDAVSRSARDTRHVVEGNRVHIESTINSVFSTIVSFYVAGKAPDELSRHIVRAFPAAFGANEASALTRKYTSHLNRPAQILAREVAGNGVAFAATIDLFAKNPGTYARNYGLTSLATRPFGILSGKSIDTLIALLRKIEVEANPSSRRH
jgi:hypothetical protein